MTQLSNNFTEKVLEWINNQGYPLEMSVASDFQRNGFDISISNYYQDFESGELREIDVAAYMWTKAEGKVSVQVALQIECKTSRDKPWIVFLSSSERRLFAPFRLLASSFYQGFLLKMFLEHSEKAEILQLSLLSPKKIGHGVTQAFTNGVDVPYKATQSAVKASISHLANFEKNNDKAISVGYEQYCIAIPVVVLDGLLFEYSISAEGEETLKSVDYSTLNWKGAAPHSSSLNVHLVTRAGLDSFIKETVKTCDFLLQTSTNRFREYAKLPRQ